MADQPALDLRGAIAQRRDNLGRWLVSRYILGIPLLWLAGITVPTAMAMLVFLGKRCWPRDGLINAVVIAWIGIGLAQAVCSLLNGMLLFDVSAGVFAVGSIRVYGWIMGGIAIAVGYSYRLACHTIIRTIAAFGGIIIVVTGLACAVIGIDTFSLPTPFGLVLPPSDFVKFYATATVWTQELTTEESGADVNFGDEADKEVRLSIFSPWPTSLGLSGIAVVLISNLDRSLWWRLIGITGGLVAIGFSHSRIAIASLIIVTAGQIFIRLSAIARSVLASMVLLGVAGWYLAGFDPISFIHQTQSAADEARAGSSMVRDMIYEASWAGFWRSPIIGNGWTGEAVIPGLRSSTGRPVAPVGSHSSISGVLYTGGIVTFGTFTLALLSSFAAIIYSILNTDFRSEARRFAVVGLSFLFTLLLFAPYEGLFTHTIPATYLLMWIGGAIAIGKKSS